LLSTKRTVQFKHAFNDPLINPPKKKVKATKANKAAPLAREVSPSPNNILTRVNKPVKQPSVPDQKNAV
jgi:hypothetical protein